MLSGVYHFSPPCKLPRGFLDPASASRIHLLIRNRLQVQPVEVCLPEQTARRSRDGTIAKRVDTIFDAVELNDALTQLGG